MTDEEILVSRECYWGLYDLDEFVRPVAIKVVKKIFLEQQLKEEIRKAIEKDKVMLESLGFENLVLSANLGPANQVYIRSSGEIICWKANCLHDLDGNLLEVDELRDHVISFNSSTETNTSGGIIARFISDLLSPCLRTLVSRVQDSKSYWENFILDNEIKFKEEASIKMIYDSSILGKEK